MNCYKNEGELFANDCEIEWKIHDIFGFPLDQNIEIHSRKFCLAGRTWLLKVFPNGRAHEKTQGWFGIALCAMDSDFDPKSLFVRISVVGASGRALDSFPKINRKCYRADKLIKSQDFISKKDEIAPDNDLTVLCEIKTDAGSEEESGDEEYIEATEGDMLANDEKSITKSDNKDFNQATTSVDAQNDAQSTALNCTKENKGEHAEEKQESAIKLDAKLSLLPKGIAKALQDYKELLLSGRYSDVTIVVQNKRFKAHRGILAARNPVFAAMLEHNMKEKETGIVTIEDMDPKAFPDFLEYLYSGQVQNLSSDNVLELFVAADKYQVLDLREECFVYMKENLSVENFCGVLSVSLRHHEKELIALATQFFIDNAVHIVKTSSWQMFMSENVVAANELFIKQIEFSNRKKATHLSGKN